MTNTEDKINQKETELKQMAEKFETQKTDLLELEKKHIQMMEEKNVLAEQLQAESELCAEAEEVRSIRDESINNDNIVTSCFILLIGAHSSRDAKARIGGVDYGDGDAIGGGRGEEPVGRQRKEETPIHHPRP